MAKILVKVSDGPVENVGEVFVDGRPVNVATTLSNPVLGSVDASQWRPQDFAPIARAILFGDRS